MRAARNAMAFSLLALSAQLVGCQRFVPVATGDAALQGPRTLGFVELRGPIPTPSTVGGASAQGINAEVDGAVVSLVSDTNVRDAESAQTDASAASDSAEVPANPVANLDGPGRARAWFVQALPAVLARAIDARGHRMALTENALVDESARGARQPLAFDDVHCELPYEALSFDESGAGYLVRGGRVFVRAPDASGWTRANACTDIGGEPWTYSPSRGWTIVAHRSRSATPAMLFTRDRTGQSDWAAVSAVDSDVTDVALDGDGSRLILAHGGHPIMIDVTREVAGAVLATASVQFEGVTRAKNGVIVWRQDGDDLDLLVSRLARGAYRRERIARDSGTQTARVLGVWVGALGQRVAVTTRGVELYEAGRAHAVEVARWPAELNTAHGISVGWLSDGRLAVVTPTGWAREG